MRAQPVRSPLRIVLTLAALAAPGPASHPQAPSAALQQQASPAEPAFSIVRVKLSSDSEADDWGIGIRGRNFWAVHVTPNELIEWAYGVNARQIEHAPDWFATERFDLDGLPEAGPQPSRDQFRLMLQAALADRFALRFHSSQKILPVYVLSVAQGGLKISPVQNPTAKSSWGVHRGWLSIQSMTFSDIAKVIQRTVFDRPVLDQTGQTDRYTFILRWRADETQFLQMQGVEVPQENGTEDADDIYTASRKQLGITIEPRKTLAPTLVVENASHPSAN